jgi:hypothetical protein
MILSLKCELYAKSYSILRCASEGEAEGTARDRLSSSRAKSSCRCLVRPTQPRPIFPFRNHHDQVSDTNNSNAHTRHHVEADRYRHLRQGRVHQGHHHRPQCLQGQFYDAFRNSRLQQILSRRCPQRRIHTQWRLESGSASGRCIAMQDGMRNCWTIADVHTGTYPPGHCPRGPHWHEQEPSPAICRVRLFAHHTPTISNTITAPRRPVTRHLLSLGVLDVPLPVFLVSLVEELTVPVRLRSVTCAAPVACSLPPRSGASGTRRST